MGLGFFKNDANSNLYFKVIDGEALIFVLCVDDLFITREDHLIDKCKKELASEFEMKDLGLMHHFLGLEVWKRPNEIILSQGKYTIDILKRFGMKDCKSMSTPMETNLKKLSESVTSSDLVDPTMHRHLIERDNLVVVGSAMISWCNRKQTSVALSTAEAEYIATCVATREVVWL
ncbi:uncharacterized mitochondrial protein AtMg00810-like [Cryptomeria japonica]|uniref:uncharacterized mitochondrial protein AtMg00810-like n=1 Tax=Cryptomeria japonica TaxID=3369 RepID=UPI0027DA55E8|nr:uncharacterized mitochondrial protein AtMg00810-like [Cryptomeria japonica]